MKDLIAKLEAATEGSREMDAEIWCAVNGHKFDRMGERGKHPSDDLSYVFYLKNGNRVTCWLDAAFTRSIDAALTLVPERWDWTIGHTNGGLTIHAQVGDSVEKFSDTPALAICIAALKARAA